MRFSSHFSDRQQRIKVIHVLNVKSGLEPGSNVIAGALPQMTQRMNEWRE
jgi:hypothetical protein